MDLFLLLLLSYSAGRSDPSLVYLCCLSVLFHTALHIVFHNLMLPYFSCSSGIVTDLL